MTLLIAFLLLAHDGYSFPMYALAVFIWIVHNGFHS